MAHKRREHISFPRARYPRCEFDIREHLKTHRTNVAVLWILASSATAVLAIITIILTGCVGKSAGIPELHIFDIKLPACNTSLRVGYLGMCSGREGASALVCDSTVGSGNNRHDRFFPADEASTANQEGQSVGAWDTAECPTRTAFEAALELQNGVATPIAVVAGLYFFGLGLLIVWVCFKFRLWPAAFTTEVESKTRKEWEEREARKEQCGLWIRRIFLGFFISSTAVSLASTISTWQIANLLLYDSHEFNGPVVISPGVRALVLQTVVFGLLIILLPGIAMTTRTAWVESAWTTSKLALGKELDEDYWREDCGPLEREPEKRKVKPGDWRRRMANSEARRTVSDWLDVQVIQTPNDHQSVSGPVHTPPPTTRPPVGQPPRGQIPYPSSLTDTASRVASQRKKPPRPIERTRPPPPQDTRPPRSKPPSPGPAASAPPLSARSVTPDAEPDVSNPIKDPNERYTSSEKGKSRENSHPDPTQPGSPGPEMTVGTRLKEKPTLIPTQRDHHRDRSHGPDTSRKETETESGPVERMPWPANAERHG